MSLVVFWLSVFVVFRSWNCLNISSLQIIFVWVKIKSDLIWLDFYNNINEPKVFLIFRLLRSTAASEFIYFLGFALAASTHSVQAGYCQSGGKQSDFSQVLFSVPLPLPRYPHFNYAPLRIHHATDCHQISFGSHCQTVNIRPKSIVNLSHITCLLELLVTGPKHSVVNYHWLSCWWSNGVISVSSTVTKNLNMFKVGESAW